MKKRVFDSIWDKITKDQTITVINMLKKLSYVNLDIYGDILFTTEQQKEFDKTTSKVASEFLSKLYGLKYPGVSLHEIKIVTGENNPREHGIYLDAKILTGEEIVKAGFNCLYCRVKNLKSPKDNWPYNILEMEKENEKYRIDVYSVPWQFDSDFDKKQKAEKCRSDILSELRKKKIY